MAPGSRRKRKSPPPVKLASPPPPPPAMPSPDARAGESSSGSALSSPDNELLAELDATVKEEEETEVAPTAKRRRVTRKNSATIQPIFLPPRTTRGSFTRGASSRSVQSPVEVTSAAATAAAAGPSGSGSGAGAGSTSSNPTTRASSGTRQGSRSSPRSPISARPNRKQTPSEGATASAQSVPATAAAATAAAPAEPEAAPSLGLTGLGIESSDTASAAPPAPPTRRRSSPANAKARQGEGHGKKPAKSSKTLKPAEPEAIGVTESASAPDTGEPTSVADAGQPDQASPLADTADRPVGSAAEGGKAISSESVPPAVDLVDGQLHETEVTDKNDQSLVAGDSLDETEAPPAEVGLASRRPTLDAVTELAEVEAEAEADAHSAPVAQEDEKQPVADAAEEVIPPASIEVQEKSASAVHPVDAEDDAPVPSGTSTAVEPETATSVMDPSQGDTLNEGTQPEKDVDREPAPQAGEVSGVSDVKAGPAGEDAEAGDQPMDGVRVEEVKAPADEVDEDKKEFALNQAAAGVSTDTTEQEGTAPKRERPAVLEERAGLIQFRVVSNDGTPESLIILTGLKNIFQRQLPKMPREYITRLVLDRNHVSMAIVKRGLQVVGGITYRPFYGRKFAEIVFCAITSSEQVKGYGSHLMNHLKDHVKFTSPIMHFLTYADNYAIGYFKKQGFTKEITLDRSVWVGYIKDYEGGTLMQCSMVPRVEYLKVQELLAQQKELVLAKIRQISKSHIVHRGLDIFREREKERERKKKELLAERMASSKASTEALISEVEKSIMEAEPPIKLDASQVPGLAESGWTPEMDELSRKPKRGPHHNLMRHVLIEMGNHASSWPFTNPVNGDEVQDYYDVIKNPMDLSTMENKLENNQYKTIDDLVVDAQLMFDNCRRYNPANSPYAKCANRLEKFLKDHLPLWRQSAGI